MTEVVINLVGPVVNHSTPHTNGDVYPQPNLGASTGGGEAVMWDPTDNHSQQAGKDIFEHHLQDVGPLPSGSPTSMRLEVYGSYRCNAEAVEAAASRAGADITEHIDGTGAPDYDPEIWVLDYGRASVTESDSTMVMNSAFKGQIQVQFWLDDDIFLGPVDILVTDTVTTFYSFEFDVAVPFEEMADGSHTVWLHAEQADLGTLAPIAEATISGARIVMVFGEGPGAARSTIDSKRGGVVFVPLPPGEYTVDAVTVSDRDALSEPSDPITVTVA